MSMRKEQTMATEDASTGVAGIELQIGGMTCASCANRIEKNSTSSTV